jgi:hypothetical protein
VPSTRVGGLYRATRNTNLARNLQDCGNHAGVVIQKISNHFCNLHMHSVSDICVCVVYMCAMIFASTVFTFHTCIHGKTCEWKCGMRACCHAQPARCTHGCVCLDVSDSQKDTHAALCFVFLVPRPGCLNMHVMCQRFTPAH